MGTHQFFDSNYASALAKLNQTVDQVLWYVLCECKGAATPAQPTFPSPPAGAPNFAQPGPSSSTRVCTTVTAPVLNLPGFFTTGDGALDIGPALLPFIGVKGSRNDANGQANVLYKGPSPIPLTCKLTLDRPGTSNAVHATLITYNGTSVGSLTNAQAAAGVAHAEDIVTIGTASPAIQEWDIIVAVEHGGVAQQVTVCADFTGGTAANGVSCCPPDAIVPQNLAEMFDIVKSHQRYRSPFALVLGATHSTLSGTGTFSIPRSIGVKVHVSAGTLGKRTSGGNPTYVYDLGWISMSDGGAMLQEKRLARADFIWLPEAAQLADHVNFFLQPGVTVDITELYAET